MSVLFAEEQAKEERVAKVRAKYFRNMKIEYVTGRRAYDRVIREYQNAAKIYFDVETSGLDPLIEGRIWLATMCLPGSNIVHVIDAQHCDLLWMKDILEHAVLVGANIGFDLKWLRKYGIRPRKVKDVIIQSRMLSAGIKDHKNSLDAICRRYFGVELAKDITKQFIMHPEAIRRMTKPREFTWEQILYAAEDVYVLEDIEAKQEIEIRKEQLGAVAELENEVVPVAADMEYDGIYVDEDDWMKLVAHAEEEKKRLYSEVANDLATDGTQTSLFPDITGSDYIINLNSGKDVKARLAARGIEVPNLDKDELLQFYQQFRDPVIKRYVNFKMLDKRTGTYGKDWIAKKHPVTGRIHTSLNQLVDTGRFSSRDPNTQNVPDNKYNLFPELDLRWNDPDLTDGGKLKYDPALPMLSYRHCFKPRPGYLFLDSDYSQMELRILAEISGDPALIEIFLSGQDMHTATAAKMFNIPIEEVTPSQRKRGKTINFAIAYGKGPTTLAEDFNLFYEIKAEYEAKVKAKELRRMPTDEQIQKEAVEKAQGFLDAYFKAFPLVKAWLDWAAEQPFETGYSLTLLGRRRYFTPVDQKKDKKEIRKIEAGMRNQGKNSPVQGGNADITKMAMVRIAQKIFDDGWDAFIVNVIHDELLVEVREDQAEAVMQIVESEMVNAALELMHKVPVKADPVIVGRWEKA